MERRISMLQRLPRSITDFKIYGLYAQETFGRAMLYVLLLAVLSTALVGGRTAWEINEGIDDLVRSLTSDMPWFEVSNGRLSMDAEMPLVMEDDGHNILIIDTTGNTAPSLLDNYQEGILITHDTIYRKKNWVETTQISLEQMNINLDKDQLLNLVPLLKLISFAVIFFLFLFFLVAPLVSALMVSAIGQFFNKPKLPFAALYKMSLYALTLPMTLFALSSFLPFDIPYFFWIYHGIALVYLKRALDTTGEQAPPAILA